MVTKKKKSESVDVVCIEEMKLDFCILGRSPGIIMNAMSEKTKRILLMPPPPKNRVEKHTTLKHVPIEEYRDSCYKSMNDSLPTRILLPSTCFKASAASVAKDVPGVTGAQIKRLVHVKGAYVHIYGIPKIHTAVVRNSDVNRTPDIRTRACIPEWACYLSLSFTKPILKEPDVVRLLANAGFMCGVGDWRSERGSGNYGQFELVEENNPDFQRIIKNGGLAAQDAALLDPSPYDSETAELLSWFNDEVKRRGFEAIA